MKHLFSCLKRYRTEALLSPLFKLFEASMELVVPLVVAAIVKNGIGAGDTRYIVHAVLVLVAFGVAGLGFALTAQYFAAKAAVGVSADLRRRLFTKLQSLSFTQIDELGTASMITRMTSDVQQVQTGVNMTLRLLLRSPIVVFGATAMAFLVDAASALVFLALIPVLFLVVFAVMAACIPRFRTVQSGLDGVYLSTRENLTGARVLRAFRKEGDECASFEAKSAALAKSQRRAGRVSALTNPLTYALVNLAVVALIWVGADRIGGGLLFQEDLVALYGYLALILVELVKFANLIVLVTRAVASERRIEGVLSMEGEPQTVGGAAPEGDAAVSFGHVSFTYEGGGAPALSDIDFSVARGETVGILGGTGSGKSTLVGLVPRFYRASEGQVRVFGADVGTVSADELRRRIGYVPQKAVLFRGTIASNLRWGDPGATDEELLRAVRIAQAEDILEAKGGLGGEVSQNGSNLSGGQRQRLTIARALVRDPEILILDDSASALDYATDARLRESLRGLGCTVLVVSQRTASVRACDRIVVLDEGRVAGIGTHEELLADCPLYGEIHRSQTEEEA